MATTSQTVPATATQPATETVVVEAPVQQIPAGEPVVETVTANPIEKVETVSPDTEALAFENQISKRRSKRRALLGCCLGFLIGAILAGVLAWLLTRRWARNHDHSCKYGSNLRRSFGEDWRTEPNFTCLENSSSLEKNIYKAMHQRNISDLAVSINHGDCTYAKAFSNPKAHVSPLGDESKGDFVIVLPSNSAVVSPTDKQLSTVTVPGPVSTFTSVLTMTTLIPIPAPILPIATGIPIPIALPTVQSMQPGSQNTLSLVPIQAQPLNFPTTVGKLPTLRKFIAQAPVVPTQHSAQRDASAIHAPVLAQDVRLQARLDNIAVSSGGLDDWHRMKHYINKDESLSISISARNNTNFEDNLDEIARIITQELADTDKLDNLDQGEEPDFEKGLKGNYFKRVHGTSVSWLNFTDNNDLPGLQSNQEGWFGYGIDNSMSEKSEYLAIVHFSKDVYLAIPAESSNTELVSVGDHYTLLQKFRTEADPTEVHHIDGFAIIEPNSDKLTKYYSLESFKKWAGRQIPSDVKLDNEKTWKDFNNYMSWFPLLEGFKKTGKLPTFRTKPSSPLAQIRLKTKLDKLLAQLIHHTSQDTLSDEESTNSPSIEKDSKLLIFWAVGFLNHTLGDLGEFLEVIQAYDERSFDDQNADGMKHMNAKLIIHLLHDVERYFDGINRYAKNETGHLDSKTSMNIALQATMILNKILTTLHSNALDMDTTMINSTRDFFAASFILLNLPDPIPALFVEALIDGMEDSASDSASSSIKNLPDLFFPDTTFSDSPFSDFSIIPISVPSEAFISEHPEDDPSNIASQVP